MQTLIKERQAELDRYRRRSQAVDKVLDCIRDNRTFAACRLTVQAESLAKVQQEQMAFIDTLTAK